MKFIKLKDYFRAYSTWVLGAITVTPVLDTKAQLFVDLIPERYKPYVISGLGILGLIVRAIKQK